MDKHYGPWIIKSTEQKYKNPWIEVHEDRVIRPDGIPGIYGVVTAKDGAHVLAIDDENFVYLTREFRYAVGKETIEVVSGGIDIGETPLATAQRELQEEIGMHADEWVELGSTNPHTSIMYSQSYLFLARKLRVVPMAREGTEVISVLRVLFHEAWRMVMDGRITHSASCVLILKAKEYLDF